MKKTESTNFFDDTARTLSRPAFDPASLLSGQYWGELRTFLQVAKTGSLTQAASLLGCSHPTVGRDIRRLEDLMGTQLVLLSKSGAKLTDKGRTLKDALLLLDQQLFSLQSNLRTERDEAEGTVRVAITDGLGVFFIVPALRHFSTQFPRLRVHLKSPGNLLNLKENQTDIMLSFVPATTQEMTTLPLGWLHFIPIVTQDYIDRFGCPSLGNLENHFFVDSDIYADKGLWSGWQSAVGRGTVAHICETTMSYGMIVKAGLGIGLLANYNMAEPSARALDLGIHVKLRLYALVMSARLEAKPVRLVFEWLEQLFGLGNPWFGENLVLEVDDPAFKEGHALLFNL